MLMILMCTHSRERIHLRNFGRELVFQKLIANYILLYYEFTILWLCDFGGHNPQSSDHPDVVHFESPLRQCVECVCHCQLHQRGQHSQLCHSSATHLCQYASIDMDYSNGNGRSVCATVSSVRWGSSVSSSATHLCQSAPTDNDHSNCSGVCVPLPL